MLSRKAVTIGATLAALGLVASLLYAQVPARARRGGEEPPAAPGPAEAAPMVRPSRPPRSELAAGKPRAAEQRTRVQLDIYEVTADAGALAKIDGPTIAKLGKTEVLAKLGELGKAQLVHSLDLPMLLDGQNEAAVKVGSRVPSVQSMSFGPSGKAAPSVDYRDVGMAFELRGVWVQASDVRSVESELKIEWSGVQPSAVTISESVKLPKFSQYKFNTLSSAHNGETQAFLVSMRPESSDDKSEATLGVVRLTMTQMEQ